MKLSRTFVLPAIALASSLFLSACAPTQVTGPELGSGSLTVQQNGEPAKTAGTLATVNWSAITNAVLTPQAAKAGVEVNRVHDGSLRILLPGKALFGNGNTLKKTANPVIKTIAEEVKIRQMLRIKVVGHTDSSGNESSNQTLSLNRAYLVARKLIQEGIRSSRIDVEGRGSVDPLVSNSDPARRAINRRVELYLYQLK